VAVPEAGLLPAALRGVERIGASVHARERSFAPASAPERSHQAESQNFFSVNRVALIASRRSSPHQRLELWFDDSEVIIFNRELRVLLPKAWLKEALRELLARDASQDVIAIAKAKDEKIRDWLHGLHDPRPPRPEADPDGEVLENNSPTFATKRLVRASRKRPLTQST
jgi:hypothetical protein